MKKLSTVTTGIFIRCSLPEVMVWTAGSWLMGRGRCIAKRGRIPERSCFAGKFAEGSKPVCTACLCPCGDFPYHMFLCRCFAFCAGLVSSATISLGQTPATSVEIDLQQQTAYLIENGRAVLSAPISSGREGHLTETGSFKVIDKER